MGNIKSSVLATTYAVCALLSTAALVAMLVVEDDDYKKSVRTDNVDNELEGKCYEVADSRGRIGSYVSGTHVRNQVEWILRMHDNGYTESYKLYNLTEVDCNKSSKGKADARTVSKDKK